MPSEIINVVSRKKGEIVSNKIEATPYEFTIGTQARWEMITSDADLEIRAGEYKKIPIREIFLEADSLAIPCAFIYHAMTSVINVSSTNGACLVDKERIIRYAYIFGQATGDIKEGDLLGVLNIFPIAFTREANIPMKIS